MYPWLALQFVSGRIKSCRCFAGAECCPCCARCGGVLQAHGSQPLPPKLQSPRDVVYCCPEFLQSGHGLQVEHSAHPLCPCASFRASDCTQTADEPVDKVVTHLKRRQAGNSRINEDALIRGSFKTSFSGDAVNLDVNMHGHVVPTTASVAMLAPKHPQESSATPSAASGCILSG